MKIFSIFPPKIIQIFPNSFNIKQSHNNYLYKKETSVQWNQPVEAAGGGTGEGLKFNFHLLITFLFWVQS